MIYRREIDGLRAVAVLPVIGFHAGIQHLSGGFVGVDVFFVISGYLITSILLEERRAGHFSLITFYERRARRILPPLFLVMFACLPFAWAWMMPFQLADFSDSLAAVSLFASNILFWREIGYFGPINEQKPLLHTWSLSVEEQYYVFYPLLLMILWRFRKWWIASIFTIIALASLLLSEWAWRNYSGANFYLLPTRAWELFAGGLVAVYRFDGKVFSAKHPIDEWAAGFGLILIAYAVIVFDHQTPIPSLYALAPVLGASLVILYATQDTIVGRILGLKPLVGIGLISYSTYLWHQPLFAFARIRSADKPSQVFMIGLAITAIVLAYFTWKYIERPFRNRKLLNRKVIFLTAGVGCAIMLTLGYFGHRNNGFPTRYPEDQRYLMSFNPMTLGRYVGGRFDELRLKPFISSNVKVFIVGDSYAQDFVNVLIESGFSGSLSTFHIASECGVLISKFDFSSHIKAAEMDSCRRKGRFESEVVRDRIRQADVLILAASWKEWQVPYLSETIAALRGLGAKRILLLGRKNFGSITPLKYLEMSNDDRLLERNRVNPEHYLVNDLMRNSVPPEMFIDFQSTVCADNSSCPVFTEDLKLISFDGEHLTKDGALYVGRRLFAHRLFADIFRPNT